MSNNKNYRKNYISYSDYVEGNAVRKVQTAPEKNGQAVPVREPRTYVGNKRVTTSQAIYRNREKAKRMSEIGRAHV